MKRTIALAIVVLAILGGCSSRIDGTPNLKVVSETELPEGEPALGATSEGFYIYHLKKGTYNFVPELHRSEDGKDWGPVDFPATPAPYSANLNNPLVPLGDKLGVAIPARGTTQDFWIGADGEWDGPLELTGTLAGNEGYLYRFADNGSKASRSLDSGKNWTPCDLSGAIKAPEGYVQVKSGLEQLTIQYLVDKKDRVHIFTEGKNFQTDSGHDSSGLLYSRGTNSGNSWANHMMKFGLFLGYSPALDTTDPDKIGIAFFGLASGTNPGAPIRISLSKDGGENWSEPLTLTSDHSAVREDIMFAMDGDFLVVACRQKDKAFAMSSLDGGNSWSREQELGPVGLAPQLVVREKTAVIASQVGSKINVLTFGPKE